jgi:hypothetical protein
MSLPSRGVVGGLLPRVEDSSLMVLCVQRRQRRNAGTQAMLDFFNEHGITADVEVLPARDIAATDS